MPIEFHDIKPLPEFRPFPWETALSIAGILAALLLGLWLLRRRARYLPPPAVPALPPDVEALQGFRELEHLRSKGSIAVRELAARASLLVRRYIEQVLEFPATEKTVGEIRGQIPQALLHKLPLLPQENSEQLSKQLMLCLRLFERATFADDASQRFNLQSEELTSALQNSIGFIESLRDLLRTEQGRLAALQAEPALGQSSAEVL